MPAARILVIGSSNTDMVIKTNAFPKPGETILGGQFFMFPGGKGANQAVAAARLGGKVTFVARIGNDVFGTQAINQFRHEHINTDFILVDHDHPSGVALITVDSAGENTIVVARGANGALSADDVRHAAQAFAHTDIALVQLEIAPDTVQQVVTQAAAAGKRVILNPAPASALPDTLLRHVDIITPNRSEAEALAGIALDDLATVEAAAKKIKARGVQHVVITLGNDGAFVYDDNGSRHLPTASVQVVDSTAAGDVFNGALAVALGEGATLDTAVAFANKAAAISVTRMGAQASAPHRDELL